MLVAWSGAWLFDGAEDGCCRVAAFVFWLGGCRGPRLEELRAAVRLVERAVRCRHRSLLLLSSGVVL